jgi:hypothetical protein
LEAEEGGVPALLPEAYGPISTSADEEVWLEGGPGELVHRAQVALIGGKVLTAVAAAALVNPAVFSTWRYRREQKYKLSAA